METARLMFRSVAALEEIAAKMRAFAQITGALTKGYSVIWARTPEV
jgi:hypothetical protein